MYKGSEVPGLALNITKSETLSIEWSTITDIYDIYGIYGIFITDTMDFVENREWVQTDTIRSDIEIWQNTTKRIHESVFSNLFKHLVYDELYWKIG